MAYEIVYEVPKSVLKKEDLEKLVEQNQLYFLRTSSYSLLYDYPCMGALERRLQGSTVEGPFESVPLIKNQGNRDELDSKVLTLVVPISSMPLNFEKVSWIKYGTSKDFDSINYLASVAGARINGEKMFAIGENVLENLRKKFNNLQQVSDSDYMASTEDCLLKFSLLQMDLYPSIKITLFGKGEIPQEHLRESGMYALSKQFPWDEAKVGMRDEIRKGLAYDLVLDIKNIDEIIKRKSVLI